MFRIGITADFDRHAKGLIDPTLAERLDGVPGLTYARLQEAGPVATPAQLREVDAVINLALTFGSESFTGHDRLTVIARWGVGYEMIDVDACTANDVALCITPEGVRRPMAEAEMTMLLARSKRLTAKDRALRGLIVPCTRCAPPIRTLHFRGSACRIQVDKSEISPRKSTILQPVAAEFELIE